MSDVAPKARRHRPSLSADDLLARLKAGETLHHGLAPGATLRKTWWLEPSRTPVRAAAINALRAAQLMTQDAKLTDRPRPRVLNKHHLKGIWPPHAVDIMRPGPHGNPFMIGRDGTRAEVVAKHRDWVCDHPEYIARVREELRGRDLVCCCAPFACHGDFLLEIAND